MGGIGLDTLRRFGRGAVVFAGLSGLGACGGVESPVVATRTAPVEAPAPVPAGDGTVLGTGSVRVALILPLSGPGATVGAACATPPSWRFRNPRAPT